MKKIIIKNTKNIDEYIKIRCNESTTQYTYVKEDNIIRRKKSLFNKDAFIQYLKSINIAKKYIQEVKNYG